MRIMSINKMTVMTKHVTCPALEGVEKNRRTIRRSPKVKVVYEKSKKQEPREYTPGGLTKIDTNSSTHQRKLMMVKSTVK
jgi:hypothetical protein